MRWRIDLHNHSCLSPCGSNLMLPSVLAIEALDAGIDILALTDHNSARNLPAFAEACEIAGVAGVFGMEVTTLEEVHVLALFEHLQDALEFGEFIEFLLPDIHNVRKLFGDQWIVDIEGKVIGELEKSLYGAAQLSFENLIEEVLARDGLAVPAHIDRPSNGVLANLGFLPDIPYSAIEVIRIPVECETWGNAIIQGSDAHFIEHIGRRSCFIESTRRDFQGLKEAFARNAIFHRT
jgi:3',5'-nucleoside bisphosphate phosphatase